MSDNLQGGDSSATVLSMNVDGSVRPDTTTEVTENPVLSNDTPPNVDNQKREEVDLLKQSIAPEQKGEDKTAPEVKQVKDYKSHSMIVDLLEEKFKDLDNGRLSDEELRDWFDTHPEFADIANRSKRSTTKGELKHQFRNLMTRDQSAKHNPDLAAKRTEQTKDGEDIEDDRGSPTKPDDKPLTRSEMLKLLNEVNESKLEKDVIKERKETIQQFSIDRNLKDEEVTLLEKNAEALLRANEDWDIEQACEAAYNAIWRSKGEPKNMMAHNIREADKTQSVADMTSWNQIVKI